MYIQFFFFTGEVHRNINILNSGLQRLFYNEALVGNMYELRCLHASKFLRSVN